MFRRYENIKLSDFFLKQILKQKLTKLIDLTCRERPQAKSIELEVHWHCLLDEQHLDDLRSNLVWHVEARASGRRR